MVFWGTLVQSVQCCCSAVWVLTINSYCKSCKRADHTQGNFRQKHGFTAHAANYYGMKSKKYDQKPRSAPFSTHGRSIPRVLVLQTCHPVWVVSPYCQLWPNTSIHCPEAATQHQQPGVEWRDGAGGTIGLCTEPKRDTDWAAHLADFLNRCC